MKTLSEFEGYFGNLQEQLTQCIFRKWLGGGYRKSATAWSKKISKKSREIDRKRETVQFGISVQRKVSILTEKQMLSYRDEIS